MNYVLAYGIAGVLGIIAFAILFKWGSRKLRDKEFRLVKDEIKRFEPSMKYDNERPYQAELQGWLKHEFPHALMEVQNGSSRPDIAIHKIAIEVKGPTGSGELQTIADKCMRYYQYYNQFIAVLFEPNYNPRLYDEWKKGMKEHFPKVVIFEKPFVKKV